MSSVLESFAKQPRLGVLELADATTASLILAHGVPSSDKLLKNYISIPWQDLYDAQLAYGEAIRPLITTEFDPFKERPRLTLVWKNETVP